MAEFEALKAQLPADLRAMVGDAAAQETTFGWSGVRVFRLDVGRYVKIADDPTPESQRDLRPEAARLAWLRGRLPAPDLLYFADQPGRQIMLITEIPGVPSFDARFEGHERQIITVLAEGLRLIHGVDVTACPFDRRLDVMIAAARRRMMAGEVDETAFDAVRQGRTTQSLYDELIAKRPAETDLVLVHGDYCMPNILIDPATRALTGFIDWGGAGVADRYLDLALAARSITHNWGEAWVAPFFAAYGLPDVDTVRIAYYQLLDEFA